MFCSHGAAASCSYSDRVFTCSNESRPSSISLSSIGLIPSRSASCCCVRPCLTRASRIALPARQRSAASELTWPSPLQNEQALTPGLASTVTASYGERGLRPSTFRTNNLDHDPSPSFFCPLPLLRQGALFVKTRTFLSPSSSSPQTERRGRKRPRCGAKLRHQ